MGKQTIPIIGERIKTAISIRGYGFREFGRKLENINCVKLRALQYCISNNRMGESDLNTLCQFLDIDPEYIKGSRDDIGTFAEFEVLSDYHTNKRALETFLITRGFSKTHSELTGMDYQRVPADWFIYHSAEIEKAVCNAVQKIIDKSEDL